MSRGDRVIAILLGLILGVGIVTAFVFLGSEGTIDSPSLGGQAGGESGGGSGANGGAGETATRSCGATIHVTGGAPPESGPAQVECRQGDRARLQVVSDMAIDVELVGYGITRTIPAGEAIPIEFTASKPGNFPLIVVDSPVGVAEVRVQGPGGSIKPGR